MNADPLNAGLIKRCRYCPKGRVRRAVAKGRCWSCYAKWKRRKAR